MILYTKKYQTGNKLPSLGNLALQEASYKVPANATQEQMLALVQKYAPRTGSTYLEGEEKPSTHLFVSGDNKAFPTLFQRPDGSWYEPEDPYAEALKTKQIFYFDTDSAAEAFARGAWKSPIKSKEQGGIFIKPENKGKFTAAAKRAGMGVQEFANKVLSNKEDYSSTTVKRANFARNAKKWN